MRYYSIDIETTGLDETEHQILQVGIAFEDTDHIKQIDRIPQREFTIRHKKISGDLYALTMESNVNIMRYALENPKNKDVLQQCELTNRLCEFMYECEGTIPRNEKTGRTPKYRTITVAGKNFNGFDRKFLEAIPGFTDQIHMRYRTIDPAMLCIDWSRETPPSLQDCKDSLKINGEVKHTALEDAIDVIKIIRKATNNYTV